MPKIPMQAVAAVAILVVGYLIGLWTGPDTGELEARVTGLEAQLEEQGGVAAGAEAAAGEVKGQLEALSGKLDEQAAAAAKSGEGLSAVEAKFNELETSLTEKVGNLEAQVHDQVTGLQEAVAAIKGDLAGVAGSVDALKVGAAAPAPAAQQVAAAPAAEPMGEPEPGVHRLGVGASAWAVEGLVSVALSAILGDDSARIFVNSQSIELGVGETVRLFDLPAEAGDCTATLKGIAGGMADIAVDCAS